MSGSLKQAHGKEEDHLQALLKVQTLNEYYRWTYRKFEPYVGDVVLDAGCGIGSFSRVLSESVGYVLAADFSEANLEVMRRDLVGTNIEPIYLDLEDIPASLAERGIDTVVCMDVLEHMEEDQKVLRALRQITKRGGHILLKVPAIPWLFGTIDVASSHFRRYSSRSLQQVVEDAGWLIVQTEFMNFAGVFPYFVKNKILRKKTNFSVSLSARQLAIARRAIPFLEKLDSAIGPPVGLSLVLAAKNPGGGGG